MHTLPSRRVHSLRVRLLRIRPLIVGLLLLAPASCGDSGDGGTGPDPDPGNSAPVARIALEITGSSAPVGAALDGSASSDADGEVVAWSWDFGDGTTASGEAAQHVFEAPGSFTVTLTVTDDQGARSSASRTVTVTEVAASRIVGAVWFDENGDGSRQAGEPGVPGMTVFLDGDGDGRRDPGEVTTVTGAAGIYHFPEVPAGDHRVTQELGIGWTNTAPGAAPGAVPAAGPAAAGAGAAAEAEAGLERVSAETSGPAGIVGGDDAAGVFPFMVSLQRTSEPDHRDAHFCGGTLVAPEWVLTASHCISDGAGAAVPPTFLEVLVGTSRLDGTGTRIPVEEVVLNPGYSPAGGFYKRDISLVRLAQRLDAIPRVFLMDSTAFTARVAVNDAGTLLGWGVLIDGGVPPVELKTAPIPWRGPQPCIDTWNDGETERFDATMLCVGPIAGEPAACSGDSGGPWMFPVAGRLHQAGAVSWGPVPCGRPNFPSAYASVPAMYAFLEANIPREPSGSVVVTVGETGARVDFGNFH